MILVYNTFIIFVCVFAVYGAYALLKELSVLLLRKNKLVIAIEAADDEEVKNMLLLAESYIQNSKCFCAKPILLCKDGNTYEYIKYGLDIYKKSGKESHDSGE